MDLSRVTLPIVEREGIKYTELYTTFWCTVDGRTGFHTARILIPICEDSGKSNIIEYVD